MAKAILKFDLDNQEDRMSYKICNKAEDLANFVWELKHNFWREWKHDEEKFTLDDYREALSDLLEEHNINIDELID